MSEKRCLLGFLHGFGRLTKGVRIGLKVSFCAIYLFSGALTALRRMNRKTIDAQNLKRALEKAARKIGKRKRIAVGFAFELIINSAAQ